MIVCIVGPSCAGKTTSANYIREKTGVPYIEASELVKDRYSERSYQGSIIEFVSEEFQQNGKDTFARDVVDELEPSTDEHTIISGFRTKEEITFVKSQFDTVETYGIYANSLLRYQRKLERDNPDPGYGYEDFIRKDFIEYKFGIMDLLYDSTDSLIINEGTFDQLYVELNKRVVERLREQN